MPLTGGMRRAHPRGAEHIRKRLLTHGGACNLGLLLRTLFRVGTPRGLQGLAAVQVALAQRNEASAYAFVTPGTATAYRPFSSGKVGGSASQA